TAGDVDVLLLDKTGTITIGNRKATKFYPAVGVDSTELIRAASLSSMSDETPEGKSIVELAGLDLAPYQLQESKFIKFTAETRCSGLDIANLRIRKGATDAIKRLVETAGNQFPDDVVKVVESISGNGGT